MIKNIIEFRLEWGETDTAGIIYYPNYFRWFDRATHTLFREIGLPIRELTDKYGYAQPIVETGCTFFVPLVYDDLLRLETVVVEVRNKTFRLQHNVYRGDELAGSGFEVRAWVVRDTATRQFKAVPIPEEMAQKLRG